MSLSAQSRKKSKKKQRPAKTETRSTEVQSNRSQTVKKEKTYPDNPRADRTFAITAESGFKSLAGFGLNGTYYVQPKIAIDVGAGLGLQIIKGGIRGRYLFLDKNFTPYVGAGVFFNPLGIDDLLFTDQNFNDVFVDINSSTFGQFIVGAEFMADKGFTVGFNLGYAASLSGENWTSSDVVDDATALTLDILYGNGVAFGFNIGWAF